MSDFARWLLWQWFHHFYIWCMNIGDEVIKLIQELRLWWWWINRYYNWYRRLGSSSPACDSSWSGARSELRCRCSVTERAPLGHERNGGDRPFSLPHPGRCSDTSFLAEHNTESGALSRRCARASYWTIQYVALCLIRLILQLFFLTLARSPENQPSAAVWINY